MTTINNVEDPAAVIAVPTDKDLDCIEGIIQHAYDDVSDEYKLTDSYEAPEWIMRERSLCQEVLAQLHDQMEE